MRRYLTAIILAIAALVAPSVTAHATFTPKPHLIGPRAGLVPMLSHGHLVPVVTGPNILSYHGGIQGIGVTSGTPRVYLVFVGPWGTQSQDSAGDLTFSGDPDGAAPYLQQLFKDLGTGGELWSGTMTQYCDGPSLPNGATVCNSDLPHVGYPAGGALAGIWYDSATQEPQAADSSWLGNEAVSAATRFGNTTPASNRYSQYVILSAPGQNPDNYQTQGFCAWHSGVSSSAGDIAFTNMPYVMDAGGRCGQGFVNAPGTLDGYSIVEGHEYAETLTDQLPDSGWVSATGQENGDECAWIRSGQGASANVTMDTGTFAMQSTWSNDTNECDIAHAIVGVVTPSPTATSTPVPPTATPTVTPTQPAPIPTPTSTATIAPPPPTPTAIPKLRKHPHFPQTLWNQWRLQHHLPRIPYTDRTGRLYRIAWVWGFDKGVDVRCGPVVTRQMRDTTSADHTLYHQYFVNGEIVEDPSLPHAPIYADCG